MGSRLTAGWRWLRERLTRRVVWDLFMVYLAVINLTLICFDLTYFWLRPMYLRTVPVVTRMYDPVKGVEPDPLTERYLELIGMLAAQREPGGAPTQQDARLAELRELSLRMLGDNPFERSGQERSLIRVVVGMRRELEREGDPTAFGLSPGEVMNRFWSPPLGSDRLTRRLAYFERRLAPRLRANFYRHYDLDGELTDRFWMLDLPFLAVFVVEFFGRWILSVRRTAHARWFLFPILNWYDLLGIVPVKGLRVFRLFRIASIYMRLQRSELSAVGDDVVSRTVKYFATIISEEISDLVALRILTETQEEIKEGTHRRIIRSVAAAHREALAAQLASQARELLASDRARGQARDFLDSNLERAVDSAAALRRLPLPDAVLRPLVTAIGQAVFEAIADTLAATLASDEGQEAMRAMIAEAVDGLVLEITEGELEELVREISLQVLEHMKEAVAVRKWALPERPARRIFTRDLGR